MNYAIVNIVTGKVRTIVRGDKGVPNVPLGYKAVLESELPPGWVREAPDPDPPHDFDDIITILEGTPTPNQIRLAVLKIAKFIRRRVSNVD